MPHTGRGTYASREEGGAVEREMGGDAEEGALGGDDGQACELAVGLLNVRRDQLGLLLVGQRLAHDLRQHATVVCGGACVSRG
jgi:hypothetical protein